jgi:hypothetical protein
MTTVCHCQLYSRNQGLSIAALGAFFCFFCSDLVFSINLLLIGTVAAEKLGICSRNEVKTFDSFFTSSFTLCKWEEDRVLEGDGNGEGDGGGEGDGFEIGDGDGKKCCDERKRLR